MKNNLPFLAACWLSILQGQAQPSFSLTPNPVYGTEQSPVQVDGLATVKNLGATTETFQWTRTILRLDQDSSCFTAVTDPYLHWFYTVSQKSFSLAPGEEGPLNITLWDTEELGCCAIAHMKLKKLGSVPDSLEAFYYLRTCVPLATTEIGTAGVNLFPNPVQQYFSLQHAESVHQMALCDASGKMLRRIPANPTNQYVVQNLPAGVYYLILENAEGSIVQVLELLKR